VGRLLPLAIEDRTDEVTIMVLQASEREQLKRNARKIREEIVEITYTCGGTHIGGALSQTDLIVAVYYKYLKFDPKNPEWEERDRFVLSKGHGGVGHAAVLAHLGFFPRSELDDFNKTGSPFGMHLDRLKVKGVDASTGSLGHGLGIACGMAYGARLLGKSWRTYVVLGDGELHGGPTWEAAMAAGHFKLAKLTAFVDRNHLCIDGFTEDIMALEPLMEKWSAFGWNVLDIDGHDFDQICDAIEAAHKETKCPTVIIARTVKGKGVAFMENTPGWHYGGLDEAMRDKALEALRRE
jgi:transketolase